MKRTIIILAIMSCLTGKAQVIDRYDSGTITGEVNGAYYKDINNFRDQFVGTWIFNQGSTSLTLQFQKRDNLLNYDGLNTYNEDILIGEYRYMENGIERINTLNNININYGNNYNQNLQHNLIGYMILRRSTSKPRCNECAPDERRMVFSYTEPNYDAKGIAGASLVVRRFTEGGVDKIKIWFYNENQIKRHDADGNAITPAPYKIPFGEYILNRQQ